MTFLLVFYISVPHLSFTTLRPWSFFIRGSKIGSGAKTTLAFSLQLGFLFFRKNPRFRISKIRRDLCGINEVTRRECYQGCQGHPSGPCRESRLTDPPDVGKATAIRGGLLFNLALITDDSVIPILK